MAYIDTPRGKATRVISSVNDRHPQYKENPRNDIAIIHSEYQLSTFDTRFDRFFPYVITPSRGGQSLSFYKLPFTPSARYVFEHENILPYEPDLSPKDHQKEMRLLVQSIPTSYTRSPMLYRLSETWVVDDLGRFYYFEPQEGVPPNRWKLRWYQYSLSGKLRNRITLKNYDGSALQLPVYTFVGLAGYHPGIQDYFISSGKYQFHHIEENKLDLRPTRVVPLETDLHNYIHDQYTLSKGWFSRSKLFYIYS